MRYTHLTEDDRYEIYERKGRGQTLAAIAFALGRNKGTISRELSRNTGQRAYRPKQAQELAMKRLQTRRGGQAFVASVTDTLRRVAALRLQP